MKNLMIVASCIRLIPEEINGFECIEGQVFKTKGLVETSGKDIETDLSSDAVLHGHLGLGEFFLQVLYHGVAHKMFLIINFKGIPLFLRTVSSYRRDVEHRLAVLDKGTGLDGKLEGTHVQ